MGSIGPVQLLIIALVILVLFGRGRISEMMGDFGKGVKSFRQGMSDEAKGESEAKPAAKIEGPAQEAAPAAETAENAPAGDKTAS
ncbi:twin-arginine translocase TatA/TatE family subunit [Aurantiacibacter sp. MUD11]|uniref:twin-arginine translocase TatA/TatE family subunit n=1 Tax=Aurantiacibacter sp. MUD11 TaxID=3003265 RepID=UPI0022AA658F|nr:twin-arginine translocase TatA/TatE family subunit [Aurantiacibacter sp. MUD11]WAT19090.1 twin-arginine translocase TatA/TatE family subunit [Aurantiacibacter sp. MUD11]